MFPCFAGPTIGGVFNLAWLISLGAIFFSEVEDLAFIHCARNCKHHKWPPVILGYWIVVIVSGVISGYLGYLFWMIVPYFIVKWVSVVFFIIIAAYTFYSQKQFWVSPIESPLTQEPLLSEESFWRNFSHSLWDTFKLEWADRSQKTVFLLAANGCYNDIILGAEIAFTLTAFLAACAGRNVASSTSQKVLRNLAGAIFLACAVLIILLN